MNMVALVIALVGFIPLAVFFFLGKVIKNKFSRVLVQLLGIAFGFYVTIGIEIILYLETSPITARVCFLYMLITAAIINFIIKKIRRKNKKIFLIIIIIAIFATVYYFDSKDDVVYKDLAWELQDGIYTVSLKVENKTKNHIGCVTRIRAERELRPGEQKRGDRGCGAKDVPIKLRPKETVMLSVVVPVMCRPMPMSIMFNVSIFNINLNAKPFLSERGDR